MCWECSLSRRVPRLAMPLQTSKTDPEFIIQYSCRSNCMYISAIFPYQRPLYECKACLGGESSFPTAAVVIRTVISLEERQHSDSDVLDSTDGPSFPTMCSRPCLQMLGNASSSLHASSLECLTSGRVGAVLYTSYLQILGTLHHPSSQSLKRIYPPPPVYCTALAGFSAGVVRTYISELILPIS